MTTRVGLFGGSFDPIHNAHLRLASAALTQLKLDRVYFVFSPRSPFKRRKSQTAPSLRLKMIRLAIKKSKKVRPALWELRRKGPSFTYDTLRWYKKTHPMHDLFFILGSDAYAGIDRWKRPSGVRRLCTLVVGKRPGDPTPNPSHKGRGNIIVLKGTFPDVSSTAIRRQLAAGKSVKGKVPPAVLKFIRQRNLYRDARFV